MRNINKRGMLFIPFMIALIGCAFLLFSCSSEIDKEINKDKQEVISTVKTRGTNELPVGKVAAIVNGNKLKIAWNSVLYNCDWGQTVSLRSSYWGNIAYSTRRYPVKVMDTEIEINPSYVGQEWGSLSVRIEACGEVVEFPLIYEGSFYSGEITACEHNFEPRESFIIIRATDNQAEIETNLKRSGRMEFTIDIKYFGDPHDHTESRKFVKTIDAGNRLTNLHWEWNNLGSLYMGILYITVRIYDSGCENLSTDECSNYMEKTISWSIANSYGQYHFSGNLEIIGK